MLKGHFLKKLFFSAVFSVCLTGCYNIDYRGEELPPIASGSDVVLYFSQEQFPQGAHIDFLGDAVASAGTNWNARELQEKLRKFAAAKGANGILIEKVEKVPAGKARPDQIKNLPSKSWDVDDNSQNAYKYFREDMLNYSRTEAAEEEIYKLVIRAKILKISEKNAVPER